MNNVGIALIGAGNIAQNVHLPIFSKLSNAKLVAICDRNKSKAKILAEKYNVPHICKDVEELFKIDGIDAVDICTSTDAHFDVATACMESGKDVLIEKPIAPTAREAGALADTAERLGRKMMVGMNHRFRSDTMMLKNYIENGELGKIYYMKTGWLNQRSSQERWLAQADKSGGGVMLDLGIVILDMMLWMTDFRKVHSVRAVMQKHQTRNVEDFVSAFIHFENDIVGTLETSWSLMRPEEFYYCNVFGEKGSGFLNPMKIVRRQGNEFKSVSEKHSHSKTENYQKSYQAELRHFVNAVLGIVPVISTGKEAFERMKIIEALYQSARERSEVVLNP